MSYRRQPIQFSPNDASISAAKSFTVLLRPGAVAFALAVLTFSGGLQARAQTNTFPTSGNVGVGTTTPSAQLDVAQTFRVLSNTQVAPSSGKGLEVFYHGAGDYGVLQTYDRDASTYKQLQFAASSFVFNQGNVGIGTPNPQNKLHVAGSITVDGNINAKYQDVAEWVPSSQQLAAGTVVVLDSTKSNQVTSSSVSYDTRVAGVISARPGIALGEKSEGKALVATTGRVKVRVDASKGPIHIGDLLVTSDVPGVAMKSEPVNLGGVQIHRPGTLIGKALEPLEKGQGEILVLLSLQ
jgi:hypothetical protein